MHSAAFIISALIGLMYIYTSEEGLNPLILGEHSHTPYLGFQRLFQKHFFSKILYLLYLVMEAHVV